MLKPISSTLQSVISFTWPMVIISVIIMVSFRICYLIVKEEKIVLYKELSMLIFGIYILCLFQVVTFQDDTTWASNNFIPFKEILRYSITSRLFYKNVIGNMIMFLPFGFFTSFYLKSEKIQLPLILTLIASISIEFVQLSIGRVFDVDDILLNILGGIIGYEIYSLLRKIGEKLPSFTKKDWFLNTLSVLVLVGLITGIVFIVI
ncbi:MAG: VanZ family protein [Bacilli bacterium]|nr:VanZ family protein [Bacilli bacterium]